MIGKILYIGLPSSLENSMFQLGKIMLLSVISGFGTAAIAANAIGNTLLAFAVCAFIVPQDFMLGGSSGIALTVQCFLPVRLSVISAVSNVSLFCLGWAFMGWKFAANSLLSTIVYPIIMGIMEVSPVGTLFVGEDKLICALYCSLLIGMDAEDAIRRMEGVRCGNKATSCPDQIAKGLKSYLETK